MIIIIIIMMVKVIISKCWCQLQALYHGINSTLIFAVIYGRRMLKGTNRISNFRCTRLIIRRCLPRGELTVKIKRRQNRSQEMQIQNRSHLWTSIQMQSVQIKRYVRWRRPFFHGIAFSEYFFNLLCKQETVAVSQKPILQRCRKAQLQLGFDIGVLQWIGL